MYRLFYERCNELLLGKFSSEKTSKELSKLNIIAQKVETLMSYQRDELHYHKMKIIEIIKSPLQIALITTVYLFHIYLTLFIYPNIRL